VPRDCLWGKLNSSLNFRHYFSVGLPVSASSCTQIISLLLNNKTLSYYTDFLELAFSGDIGPKITVLFYVCTSISSSVYFFRNCICVDYSMIDSVFVVAHNK